MRSRRRRISVFPESTTDCKWHLQLKHRAKGKDSDCNAMREGHMVLCGFMLPDVVSLSLSLSLYRVWSSDERDESPEGEVWSSFRGRLKRERKRRLQMRKGKIWQIYWREGNDKPFPSLLFLYPLKPVSVTLSIIMIMQVDSRRKNRGIELVMRETRDEGGGKEMQNYFLSLRWHFCLREGWRERTHLQFSLFPRILFRIEERESEQFGWSRRVWWRGGEPPTLVSLSLQTLFQQSFSCHCLPRILLSLRPLLFREERPDKSKQRQTSVIEKVLRGNKEKSVTLLFASTVIRFISIAFEERSRLLCLSDLRADFWSTVCKKWLCCQKFLVLKAKWPEVTLK